GLLRVAGNEPAPTLESNSVIVLFSHVRSGRWATIMPAKLAETLGLTDNVRSIPIVDPLVTHAVGLVVPDREPTTPLITALLAEARQLAKLLEQPSAAAAGDPAKPAGDKRRTTAKGKSRSSHRRS
ncbi:MAG: LysR family transcriptional regulator substrate-binding protein, partial [Xanthobacteraceae bacterium]